MKQHVIQEPGWWKGRTALERRLTIGAGVSAAVAIGLAAALGVLLVLQTRAEDTEQHPDTYENKFDKLLSTAEALSGEPPAVIAATHYRVPDRPDKEGNCYTPGCVHTASTLLSYMDETVDPCEDFYDFACGNFAKKFRIPDDKTSLSAYSLINDELQKQIRAILDEPPQSDEPKPFALVKTLYKACMNKTLIEERGSRPLLEMIKRLGGWPLLEGNSWNEKRFDWKTSMYNFRAAGLSMDYFLEFSISADSKNSTRRVINLDQASLGLILEYLNRGVSDKLVKAYSEYMVDIAVLLGANREQAVRELGESLDFEIKLANISLPNEKRRNATALYNPMSIKELQQKFPSIPWLEYFNTLLTPHAVVDENEVTIVNVPTYISHLEILLAETPKRVQANYVMWRATSATVSYLTEELRRRQLAYQTVLSGKTERGSRWKECAEIVSERLSLAIGALYIKKYFDEDSKMTALEMVNDIRFQFRSILQNVDWMDEKTRKAALDKADSMTSHIAYPNEILDNHKLLELYEPLEIHSDKLMESMLNMSLFSTDYVFSQLRKPVNKSDWVTHGRPAVVNAFYSSDENSIQFPAGILQGVLFSAQRPRYMNYGGIGFVIGHEITHGFDDQGRQFDKEGNLVDWWQESTKDRYLAKAKCIIDQYSNYTVDEVGLNLNGINTQGENIADNGGIKEAYLAYNQWVKDHHEEKRLPGLNYSPRQLFWLSMATTWCYTYRAEALKLDITAGVHSPARFRIIGPLSNMDEFAKDYKCPPGSPMNPVNKCRVW